MAGYVDYHNTFAQHHNVSAMVGAQYELKEYDYFGVSVKDIQNSLETVNGAGLVNLTDKHGTKWHEAVMSYYSRLNYNYKSKYLLEVNMRSHSRPREAILPFVSMIVPLLGPI